MVLTAQAQTTPTNTLDFKFSNSANPASPTPSASVAPKTVDHDVVYFARDRLPPVAGHVDGAGQGQGHDQRGRGEVAGLDQGVDAALEE